MLDCWTAMLHCKWCTEDGNKGFQKSPLLQCSKSERDLVKEWNDFDPFSNANILRIKWMNKFKFKVFTSTCIVTCIMASCFLYQMFVGDSIWWGWVRKGSDVVGPQVSFLYGTINLGFMWHCWRMTFALQCLRPVTKSLSFDNSKSVYCILTDNSKWNFKACFHLHATAAPRQRGQGNGVFSCLRERERDHALAA